VNAKCAHHSNPVDPERLAESAPLVARARRVRNAAPKEERLIITDAHAALDKLLKKKPQPR
jgi:hypothetical protein